MDIDKKEQGRKNRNRGNTFERSTRNNLEKLGFIVCKWNNTIKDDKIVSAPHKYNPFTKIMTIGNGFPDFIAYKKEENNWKIIAVEAKYAKYLDKNEKEMCDWYLKHGIFDKIYISYSQKGKLKYYNYEDKEDKIIWKK